MYNKVTEADIAALRAILGEANVIFGEAINPDYAHDELGGISCMPEALVRVHTTEEVSAIMRHAYARNIPVTVRLLVSSFRILFILVVSSRMPP